MRQLHSLCWLLAPWMNLLCLIIEKCKKCEEHYVTPYSMFNNGGCTRNLLDEDVYTLISNDHFNWIHSRGELQSDARTINLERVVLRWDAYIVECRVFYIRHHPTYVTCTHKRRWVVNWLINQCCFNLINSVLVPVFWKRVGVRKFFKSFKEFRQERHKVLESWESFLMTKCSRECWSRHGVSF